MVKMPYSISLGDYHKMVQMQEIVQQNAGLNAFPRTHCTILLQRYSYVTAYLGLLLPSSLCTILAVYLYMYGCAACAVLGHVRLCYLCCT